MFDYNVLGFNLILILGIVSILENKVPDVQARGGRRTKNTNEGMKTSYFK